MGPFGVFFFLLDNLYYDVKCWALFSESGVYKANNMSIWGVYTVFTMLLTYVRHLIS
jgi:hypothetical protein